MSCATVKVLNSYDNSDCTAALMELECPMPKPLRGVDGECGGRRWPGVLGELLRQSINSKKVEHSPLM